MKLIVAFMLGFALSACVGQGDVAEDRAAPVATPDTATPDTATPDLATPDTATPQPSEREQPTLVVQTQYDLAREHVIAGTSLRTAGTRLWFDDPDATPARIALQLPQREVFGHCLGVGDGVAAVTAGNPFNHDFAVLEVRVSPGPPSWTTNLFEADGVDIMSCPVYGADGAIYVALGRDDNDSEPGLELVRLANGFTSRRVLSDITPVTRAEVHREGNGLVVGYCQASIEQPCARNLMWVDPERLFADAEFSFGELCEENPAAVAVCAYEVNVPANGYLASVDGQLWRFELVETLGELIRDEASVALGRWAASPLGTELVTLPTGFGVDLFSTGSGVVGRVPLAARNGPVHPDSQWLRWEPAGRTWTPIVLSTEEIQTIEANFTPAGNLANWHVAAVAPAIPEPPTQTGFADADVEHWTGHRLDGVLLQASSGLWAKEPDGEWHSLPLQSGLSECLSAQGDVAAITVRSWTSGHYEVREATVSPGSLSWTANSFENDDAQIMSCPAYGADGAIYVVLGRWRFETVVVDDVPVGSVTVDTALELVRLADGVVTRRTLSTGEIVLPNRVEVNRDGNHLVVGYCSGSDLGPCSRNLVRVDPEQFFANAEFSFDHPCAADDQVAVCAHDFTVSSGGYLNSVNGQLWHFELHERLAEVWGGEVNLDAGRWATGPLGSELVPLPTGFGVDLLSTDTEVVARVPRIPRTWNIQTQYEWFRWEPASRTWSTLELSGAQVEAIEANYSAPVNRSNWWAVF